MQKIRSFVARSIAPVAGAAASLAVAAPSFAAGTLTLPAIDLTDFYTAVGLILGVSVAVMIVRRVRGQIK